MTHRADTPPIRGIFRTDARARAAYAEGAGIYRILPAAVAVPQDAADVVTLVRWAAERGQSLIPRGAGSAMPGSNVGDGIVVDLTALEPQRIALAPESLTATTSAALPWAALTADAQDRAGLRLPPDPSSGRWATLGGMVATNAAGARTVRYGPIRPWVQELTLVTADGEIARLRRGQRTSSGSAVERRFATGVAPAVTAQAELIRSRFPRTRKNTAGYALDAWLHSGDLLDLVIGAEGTLGIVTEITWKLAPIPPHRASLRVVLGDLAALPEAVSALLALEPSALELLDRTFLDVVPATRLPAPVAGLGPGAQAVLLVEFEGDDPGWVRGAVSDASRLMGPLAAEVETALTVPEVEAIWELRHAASPILAALPEHRRSLQVIEDGCVPVPRLGEYVALVRESTRRHGVPAVIFGHAGDGHVHVNLLPDTTRPGWQDQLVTIYDEVSDGLIRLGGTPSGEHGDGRLRAGLMRRIFGPEIVALFGAVKDAFDPSGIFNPGVKLPFDGAPPITRLKAGADAVPIPADIAAGLRAIERAGRYETPRLALADRGAPHEPR